MELALVFRPTGLPLLFASPTSSHFSVTPVTLTDMSQLLAAMSRGRRSPCPALW
jgi:hypothetical protein